MSAIPAQEITPEPISEKIRVPEDLDLPTPVRKVFENLTSEGAKQFSQEIVDALEIAQKTRDLSEVKRVVEAWYRTLLFYQSEGFMESWEDDQESEPRQPVDEVLRRLKIEE